MTDVILETLRLTLRRLQEDDLDSMHAYRSDPTVCRFQSFEPQTREEVKAFIQQQAKVSLDRSGGWRQLAIASRELGTLVGDCGIWFDPAGQQVEFGITVASRFQGNGYAVEMLEKIFHHLFLVLGVHRIKASVDPKNAASMRLMSRLGMRQEALHLKSLWFKGGWADDAVFALLASEWPVSNLPLTPPHAK